MRFTVSKNDIETIGIYAAQALLEKLRKKALVESDVINTFNHLPWIDFVRNEVVENDKKWIMNNIADSNIEIKCFSIFLMSKLKGNPEKEKYLIELWNKNKNFETRLAIAPRLLDFNDLEVEIHENIYRWIRDNWNRWTRYAAAWYGGPSRVLDGVQARLEDPRLPSSKAWHYLCIATKSNDREAACELIAKWTKTGTPFVRKVAKELLKDLRK